MTTATLDARVTGALARVEGRRVLRHPATLVGAALSTAMVVGFARSDPEFGVQLVGLLSVYCVPLAAGVLVAANLSALRSRRDGTDELYASTPTPPARRSVGLLVGLLAAMVPAATLVAAAYLHHGLGGQPAFDGATLHLGPADLGQGVVFVAFCGVVGVLLARWIPSVAVAPFAVVGVWFTMFGALWSYEGTSRWFRPLVNPGTLTTEASAAANHPAFYDLVALRWHIGYLAALTALLAVAALLRESRSKAVLLVGAVALTATALLGSAQL